MKSLGQEHQTQRQYRDRVMQRVRCEGLALFTPYNLSLFLRINQPQDLITLKL